MTEKPTEQSKKIKIPHQLIGSIDLGRLIRELKALEDFMHQAQIRKPGTSVAMPRSSHILEETASLNNFSLLETEDREKLLSHLQNLSERAPLIHISFAVDPSAKFTQKIVSWCRQNLHQYILVEIGLQPTIAVGCFVRTDNKVFDLSLRNKFSQQKNILVQKLAEGA